MELNIGLLMAMATLGFSGIDWGYDILGGDVPHSYKFIKHRSQKKLRRLQRSHLR